MLPHPARSAYARFLTFSARTGLIGKGSKGSNSSLRYNMSDLNRQTFGSALRSAPLPRFGRLIIIELCNILFAT